MSEPARKQIVVELPQHLVNEVDGVLEKENGNYSEFISQATKMYLRERKKTSNSRDDAARVYGNGKN